ncbi:hypothetical protein LTR70_003721 [Exophiala xenobiotica]|uniref:Yippee domain-containing protein n=1 Tax=Lithohypha guttulata TaxID=1690604 RepID=A0ABR0KI46_9EURO|nr:hypothetical protein LTR24_002319 [Lithohypha guttulata]KAK5322773.1 hypothetical protein LTR70_003721 [Exophiala xenobiotica]
MSSLFRKGSDPPAVFPSYLLPPLPFRRSSFAKSRHSSTSTTPSTSTTDRTGTDTPSSNPFSRCPTPIPAPFTDDPIDAPTDKYLHGHTSHIHCAKCATDLCLSSQVISKGFTGRHGRAYLIQGHPSSKFASTQRTAGLNGALPNTFLSRPIARNLVTGQHMVSDLSCSVCGSLLGWKYVEASEENQKYKVGKFILETKKIRVGVRWDNTEETGFGNTGLGGYDEVLPLSLGEMKRLGDGMGKGTEELEFDSQDEDECEDLFAGVWSPVLASRRRQRKGERFRRKAGKVFVPRANASQDSLGL